VKESNYENNTLFLLSIITYLVLIFNIILIFFFSKGLFSLYNIGGSVSYYYGLTLLTTFTFKTLRFREEEMSRRMMKNREFQLEEARKEIRICY